MVHRLHGFLRDQGQLRAHAHTHLQRPEVRRDLWGAYSITAHSHDPAADMRLIKYLTNAASEQYVATDTSFGFVPAMSRYINLYRQKTPKYANITNAVLASGRTLDYPPSTIQFGNALVSGFENIVLRHSGTVPALLSTLQKTYGSR